MRGMPTSTVATRTTTIRIIAISLGVLEQESKYDTRRSGSPDPDNMIIEFLQNSDVVLQLRP